MKRRALRALAATAVAAALASGLAACAGESDPDGDARPVTTEESQRLAVARFHSFDAGSRGFAGEIVEEATEIALQGWVDYASGIGYAMTTGPFEPQAMLWTDGTVGIIPATPDADGNPVLPIPALDDPGWVSRPADPASRRLDALLSIVGNLGADRPDNPLLVQQSGALWLREDEVDGVPVTVFAAPPSDEPLTADSEPVTADTSALRLWVDADGVIRRAEARIGTDWTTIDFTDPAPALALPEASG